MLCSASRLFKRRWNKHGKIFKVFSSLNYNRPFGLLPEFQEVGDNVFVVVVSGSPFSVHREHEESNGAAMTAPFNSCNLFFPGQYNHQEPLSGKGSVAVSVS